MIPDGMVRQHHQRLLALGAAERRQRELRALATRRLSNPGLPWDVYAELVKTERLISAIKAGYNPAQPRVPRGNADGGQWTDSGAGTFTYTSRSGRTQTITDAPLERVYPLESLIPAVRANRAARQLLALLRRPRRLPMPSGNPEPSTRPSERRISAQRQERLAQKELKKLRWIDENGEITGAGNTKLGSHKSAIQWLNDIRAGKWSQKKLIYIKKSGTPKVVNNRINKANRAVQYQDRITGQFWVEDTKTNEVIQLGKVGYRSN